MNVKVGRFHHFASYRTCRHLRNLTSAAGARRRQFSLWWPSPINCFHLETLGYPSVTRMNEQREDRQVTGPTLRVVRPAAARWRWLLLNETGIRTEWEALWGCATREQVSIYFPCHSIDEIRDRMCQPVAESNQRLARVPRPFGARRAAGSPFRQLIRFPDRQSIHFPSWTSLAEEE